MRLLGLWTRHFRLFLQALNGTDCPFCAVVQALEHDKLARIAERQRQSRRRLCGAHLSSLLRLIPDCALRVAATQAALRTTIQIPVRPVQCEVCALDQRVINRLARMIGCIDGRIRFEKAIQSGPLVCRAHFGQIIRTVPAEHFAQLQYRKLQALIDELGQARLRQSDELDDLIGKAVIYLGTRNIEGSAVPGEAPAGASKQLEEAALREFTHWDDEKFAAHLGDVESELASLRYRNAVLSEENRRLKLAHVAGEAMRRVLESDRARLLAKDSGRNSNLLKAPERR